MIRCPKCGAVIPLDGARCASCGTELPARGNRRRRVPRLGGKLRIVCPPCAEEIDAQATIDEAEGTAA